MAALPIYWPTVPARPVHVRQRDGSLAQYAPMLHAVRYLEITEPVASPARRAVSDAERSERQRVFAGARSLMSESQLRHLRRLAIHEAGHAVYGRLYCGVVIDELAVDFGLRLEGLTLGGAVCRWSRLDGSDGPDASAFIAGGVAEGIEFGSEHLISRDDLEEVVKRLQGGDSFALARARAETRLRQHWGTVQRVAALVETHGIVAGEDVHRAIEAAA